MTVFRRLPILIAFAAATILAGQLFSGAIVQGRQAGPRAPVYDQLKAFSLGGGSAEVNGLVLKRDRVEMTFTGTFYFATPIEGKVTGAVFIGTGTMKSDVPPIDFERENVKRLLGADTIESDFKTAVLRMTDDTYNVIGNAPPSREPVPAPAAAQKLATDFEPQLLKESGLNLSARLAVSMMNGENPGVFFAQFDGGRRGRFSYALDPQTRILVSKFGINGGEKGLIFAYQQPIYDNETWLAFYLQSEYAAGRSAYSDANDLVDITRYQLRADVTDPASRLGIEAQIDLQARAGNVRAVSFNLGEGLGAYQNAGLKYQFKVSSASVAGQKVAVAQEPWESGFTVFLPAPLAEGDKLSLDVVYDGNFMISHPLIPECFYLASNDIWLPRHGYLDRATFDLTYLTAKRHKVASNGQRVSEQPSAENKDLLVTKYQIDQPVALVAFGLGPFVRTTETLKFEAGGEIPLEFNGTQKNIQAINEKFILDELSNSVRYFSAMFGKYPYSNFGALFHPRNYGQGFATMLFIPNADRAGMAGNLPLYQFISHETAHQWWGNIVAWRSYRDQWLSEGFAQYSAMLYAAKRDGKPDSLRRQLREAHDELLQPPSTLTGVAKGRLADIGPIILGQRLNSTRSFGAYQALIYSKGALVLRMLNMLLTDPATPDDDSAFRKMMGDFVERRRNGAATTEEFFAVAGEHFVRSKIAQKHGLANLGWFYKQWVTRSEFPSYAMEYELKPQDGGKFMVTGTIAQTNVPADWIMPVPVVFSFSGNQVARTTVLARGPSTPFELTLPAKPNKVELDPDSWVLSEKTTTKGK